MLFTVQFQLQYTRQYMRNRLVGARLLKSVDMQSSGVLAAIAVNPLIHLEQLELVLAHSRAAVIGPRWSDRHVNNQHVPKSVQVSMLWLRLSPVVPAEPFSQVYNGLCALRHLRELPHHISITLFF